MATTTPDNIMTPDAGDDYALTQDLLAMADSIQDGLVARANYYVGGNSEMAAQEANAPEGAMFYNTDDETQYRLVSGVWVEAMAGGVVYFRWANATERTSQAGMQKGDRGYQEDTGVDYWYSGTAWLANIPGLNLVIPGGVSGSGVSVSPTGLVTLSSASSVNIDGVFSSRFSSYKIMTDIVTSGNALVNMQFRAGGVTNTGSVYDKQVLRGYGSTVDGAQALAQTAWSLQGNSGAGMRHVLDVTLSGPFLASPTQALGSASSSTNPMTSASGTATVSMLHRTASSYDGLMLSASTGTLSGTLQIFGYAL